MNASTARVERTDEAGVRAAIAEVCDGFASSLAERLQRRQLERADFEALADAGFLRTGLPRAQGGLWQDGPRSTRLLSDLVRTIARADPSVALVAAMHPSVLVIWLEREQVPEPDSTAWSAQRAEVFGHVADGHWFGTVASEPGAGGDLMATRALARPCEGGSYRITGDKIMGSGSGIAAFMITTALTGSEPEPDVFLLDMREVPGESMRITREWNGYGMGATQSHAYRLEEMPARRAAWPGHVLELAPPAVSLAGCLFTAVTVGVLDAAIATARRIIGPRAGSMGAFERVEWTGAVNQHWTASKVLDGMLDDLESGAPAAVSITRGKLVVAELAESTLQRLTRVLGGSTLARPSPFGQWLQDVRALGYLRPPWPLSHDRLFEASLAEPDD